MSDEPETDEVKPLPENDSEEIEVERIEEDLKTMAKQYEVDVEEVPRSLFKQLVISFSFVFGPILLPFGIFSKNQVFKETVLLFSGSITTVLLIIVIFMAWKKSKTEK